LNPQHSSHLIWKCTNLKESLDEGLDSVDGGVLPHGVEDEVDEHHLAGGGGHARVHQLLVQRAVEPACGCGHKFFKNLIYNKGGETRREEKSCFSLKGEFHCNGGERDSIPQNCSCERIRNYSTPLKIPGFYIYFCLSMGKLYISLFHDMLTFILNAAFLLF
jgi:hypothetical protein